MPGLARMPASQPGLADCQGILRRREECWALAASCHGEKRCGSRGVEPWKATGRDPEGSGGGQGGQSAIRSVRESINRKKGERGWGCCHGMQPCSHQRKRSHAGHAGHATLMMAACETVQLDGADSFGAAVGRRRAGEDQRTSGPRLRPAARGLSMAQGASGRRCEKRVDDAVGSMGVSKCVPSVHGVAGACSGPCSPAAVWLVPSLSSACSLPSSLPLWWCLT